MSPTDRRSAHLGFTLIELLLTVSLFSVLMAAVSGLVMASMRVQATWGKLGQPYEALGRAVERLEDDIELALPFYGVPVVVDAERLELARVAPHLATDPSWLRVIYRMDDGALVREEFPWQDDATLAEPLRREVLFPLESGHFSVASVDAQTGELRWSTDWDGATQGVPHLVTFDCAFLPIAGRPPVSFARVINNPAGTLPQVERP